MTKPGAENDPQATSLLPDVDAAPAIGDRPAAPEWVEVVRGGLSAAGRYLVFAQDGRQIVFALDREWTRIGRSLGADLRFDDATVSRRHALIASEAEGVRVLDDRSLNGIQVNGRRVEWSPLTDGDVFVIGRHTIYFVDTLPQPAGAPSGGASSSAD